MVKSLSAMASMASMASMMRGGACGGARTMLSKVSMGLMRSSASAMAMTMTMTKAMPRSRCAFSTTTTRDATLWNVRDPDFPLLTAEQLRAHVREVPQLPPLPTTRLPILSIGAGNITQIAHLPAYRKVGFHVAGMYDANVSTAESTARQFGVPRVYTSIADMVRAHANERVVYDVAVPASAVLDILRQLPIGAHVLIQKPMGETLADARAIVRVCEERQMTAALNFQLRTAPYIIALKHLVQQGVIGHVTSVDVRVNCHMPWEKWVFLEKAARMEPIYHSIHYVDLMRDLLGNPSHVHAYTCKNLRSPKLHSVASNYLFVYDSRRGDDDVGGANFMQATIHTHHAHRWGLRHAESYVKVEGTKGCLKACMGLNLDYPNATHDYLHVITDACAHEWVEVPLKGAWIDEAFIGPMASIMRYAEGSADRIPTAVHDAYRTMALIEGAYKSQREATPVDYRMA